ncbi:MAG: PhoH family protein [Oligoflexia bacterium]|nr:PhoH family protein [Oligoflexia bacterium]
MKTFVLDTNILLLDPLSIYNFGPDDVHVPLICIEELDRFKKDQNENGRNARYFSRVIDELRSKGSLADGVKLDNGSTLIINNTSGENLINKNLVADKSDNIILSMAIALKEKGKDVTLVTKDINLRLKADVFKVRADDYGQRKSESEDEYSGHMEGYISLEEIEQFNKNGFLAIPNGKLDSQELFPNQYLTIKDPTEQKQVYARYSKERGGIVTLNAGIKEGVWGIYPKNLEQRFALDALLEDSIKLVTLTGKAGTGKTLIAIAAALEKTISHGDYIRLLVSRPVQPMGKDLGFLPGTIEEKMNPWMLPIFDALDFLFGKHKSRETGPAAWGTLKEKGLLQVEPLTYIRGRSIPAQYFIIDEAQNLSPHEVKTIVTRVAEGSKVVLAGDCDQIDNPYLDSINNGLSYVVDRLKDQDCVAHITLTCGERSQLSEVASKLL